MAEEFGYYLRQLREGKGLTINQLAALAGISGAQISRIENGLRGVPKPATLRKIAEATDVSYEEPDGPCRLFNRDGEQYRGRCACLGHQQG